MIYLTSYEFWDVVGREWVNAWTYGTVIAHWGPLMIRNIQYWTTA